MASSGSVWWPLASAAAICSAVAFNLYKKRSNSLQRQLLEAGDMRDKDEDAPALDIPFEEVKERLYKFIERERVKHLCDIEELRTKIVCWRRGNIWKGMLELLEPLKAKIQHDLLRT